jgi:peroxiredoxin
MKRNILIFSMLVLTFVCSCSKKEKTEPVLDQKTVVVQPNDLPTMALTMLDGSQLQAKDLKGSTVIILFQPDCDHCQREAQAIHENIKAFENYSVYFVSGATPPELDTFARQYGFSDIHNVYFASTQVQSIIDNFGQISAPSLYVYNDMGKLVTKFNGETDITQILESI